MFNNTYTRRKFITNGSITVAGIIGTNIALRSFASLRHNKQTGLIPTLTGEINSSHLGTTLMHEHILFGEIPEALGQLSVEIAIKLLNKAAEAGISTIVDMTPVRDIHLYKQIAANTRVKIIASTGYYLENKMPEALRNSNELQMEQRMYKEVTEGIDGTGIRAGIIKIAVDKAQMNNWEKMVYRAAVRVQKATGVPIGTHAWIGALEQFSFLMKNGVNPNQLNLAHIDTVAGWEDKTREQIAKDFLKIVKEGGYLLFNNFGCPFYTPWDDLVYLLRYLCDKGYANRIMVSQDCNWEWKDGRQVFEAEENHPEAAKRDYAYFMTHEVLKMIQAGFSRKEIDIFLIENPRNYFTRR